MQLYFSPLSCSLVPRIVAAEAGIELSFTQVEVYTKELTGTGRSFIDESPTGLVPLLRLEDGTKLTEVAAIVQYLADLKPAVQLAPAWGTPERYELVSWLSFLSTELHKKVLWPLFSRLTPREAKQFARSCAPAVLDRLERQLLDRPFLIAGQFSAADAYLAWALCLLPHAKLSLGERPALSAYAERMFARPSVRDAIALETPLAIAAMERQAARA